MKIRNHPAIHATALKIRQNMPELNATDLFMMACGIHGVRRFPARPKLP